MCTQHDFSAVREQRVYLRKSINRTHAQSRIFVVDASNNNVAKFKNHSVDYFVVKFRFLPHLPENVFIKKVQKTTSNWRDLDFQ